MATKKKTKTIKTPFYRTVKWVTWSWAIIGIATIIYSYNLLWEFKKHAERYNDFNQVWLTWEKPQVEPMEGWVLVADYCLGETCGRMEGADLYYSRAICELDRDEVALDLIDAEGVWAYRCVEFQEVLDS